MGEEGEGGTLRPFPGEGAGEGHSLDRRGVKGEERGYRGARRDNGGERGDPQRGEGIAPLTEREGINLKNIQLTSSYMY